MTSRNRKISKKRSSKKRRSHKKSNKNRKSSRSAIRKIIKKYCKQGKYKGSGMVINPITKRRVRVSRRDVNAVCS